MNDKITIQPFNMQTGKLDRSGDAFRIMYTDNHNNRNSIFCDDKEIFQALSHIFKNMKLPVAANKK